MRRRTKATAHVGSEACVGEPGSRVGKKRWGETRTDEGCGGGVDIKYENLDRRADESGEQDLPGRVHTLRRNGLRHGEMISAGASAARSGESTFGVSQRRTLASKHDGAVRRED